MGVVLSENEQEKIGRLAGRLASTFEKLFNMQGSRDGIREDDCVDLTFELLEMFSRQDCNHAVDLFKNIYNRRR